MTKRAVDFLLVLLCIFILLFGLTSTVYLGMSYPVEVRLSKNFFIIMWDIFMVTSSLVIFFTPIFVALLVVLNIAVWAIDR